MNEAVDEKLNTLIIKRTKVRAARDLLPSQIELVRANALIGNIDQTMRDVKTLAYNASAELNGMEDVGKWLATTNELIQRKLQADEDRRPTDFERWLKTPIEPSAGSK